MNLYYTYLYPEGEYEAVLITIGDGQGANWWCVLFPPLCFLDFADGALVDDTDTDEDVTENRAAIEEEEEDSVEDRKSTRLNSSHVAISYAVFCLKKKNL